MREDSPLTESHGEVEDAISTGREIAVNPLLASDHLPKGGHVIHNEVSRKHLSEVTDSNADEGVPSGPSVDNSTATGRPADTRAQALQSG
jgi:hypothetical protein